ncbi:beta-1,6-N-acetylglucosaminyltransferase [Massilia sp. Se16.2.3]|uniref:beta-1,6-N-acetylglucosaminyltransferase n=1 Tax=Massilia sp. Se16.2.3 TaxID=2709303 RepID=UPI0035A5CFB7
MPYGGSAWWTLSRPCLIHLLGQVDQQPRLARFFSTVLCPDEMFFQTLVMASPFACRVLPQSFRYVQWPEGSARNPMVLVDADFEPIRASGAHFCRKLDSVASAGLRARLEQAAQGRAGG